MFYTQQNKNETHRDTMLSNLLMLVVISTISAVSVLISRLPTSAALAVVTC